MEGTSRGITQGGNTVLPRQPHYRIVTITVEIRTGLLHNGRQQRDSFSRLGVAGVCNKYTYGTIADKLVPRQHVEIFVRAVCININFTIINIDIDININFNVNININFNINTKLTLTSTST